jgi:multicomponent Na+:H+ antiporter subunit E
MTAVPAREAQDVVRPGRLRVLQIPVIVWLTVVWVGLWGDVSFANVLGGLALSVTVCLLFPLPPLPMHLHVRVLPLCWLVIRFLADVVVASVEVSWKTVQFHRLPRNAVIEVDLDTTSDLILTVVAEMVSLVPGSLVVEARRSTHTLFLHVLDAKTEAGADKMRTQVMRLERRVVRALGSGVPRGGQVPAEQAVGGGGGAA